MRIVLADDHAMFRHCVRALLETAGMSVVGEASNGVEALRMVSAFTPDALVLDFNMPLQNGIDVARTLRDSGASTRVVMLSMYEEESSFLEAFRAGVKAYVLKTKASSELVHAVRAVCRGGVYLCPEVTGSLVDACLRQQEEEGVQLSFRERQILQLVAEGTITREIANLLNLSVKAVESHRSALMRKLDATNIAGLVRQAVRLRVIRP